MPLLVDLVAVVEFQHTSSDDELEHFSLTDTVPSDGALQALLLRLENLLRAEFQPRRVQLETEVGEEEEDGLTDLSCRQA